MKKSPTLFFLALLCLVGCGIALYGQKVAHPTPLSAEPSGSDITFPGASGEGMRVVIYGEVANQPMLDSIDVKIYSPFISQSSKIPKPYQKQLYLHKGRMADGVYPSIDRIFRFDSEKYTEPIYVDLGYHGKPFLNRFLAFPGDSVKIRVEADNNWILFQGPQAEFFKVQHELATAEAQFNFGKNPILLTHDKSRSAQIGEPTFSFGRKLQIIEKGMDQLQDLKSTINTEFKETPAHRVLLYYQQHLTEERRAILEANLWGRHQLPVFRSFYYLTAEALRVDKTDLIKPITAFYHEVLSKINFPGSHREILVHAPDFQDWLILKAKIESLLEQDNVVEWLLSQSTPASDRALARYILNESQELDLDRPSYVSLLERVAEPGSLHLLKEFGEQAVIGEQAFPFSLPNPKGELVKLEDLKGKWLFVDFWYTGCGGCVQFYRDVVSKLEHEYADNPKLEILSINTDSNRSRWEKSLKGSDYTSEHSINLTTEGPDHPILVHYNIQAFPYQLLIDPEGRLYKSGDLRKPAEELIREINLLINQ